MKSYCVKQKKQTQSIPGKQRVVRTKNNRLMIKSAFVLNAEF